MRKTIVDSILAGICISIGGVAFLKVGGIIGAVLFSFGLITVVCYKMKLYTGVSGFVETKRDWLELPVIIVGNIIGCALVALAINSAIPELADKAHSIVDSRLDKGFWNVTLLAIFCASYASAFNASICSSCAALYTALPTHSTIPLHWEQRPGHHRRCSSIWPRYWATLSGAISTAPCNSQPQGSEAVHLSR